MSLVTLGNQMNVIMWALMDSSPKVQDSNPVEFHA